MIVYTRYKIEKQPLIEGCPIILIKYDSGVGFSDWISVFTYGSGF
jgi:hypothetical protein